MSATPDRPCALIALGFDFGLRRIGAAVGQQISGTAQALETIAVNNLRPDWDAITSLVEVWQPDLFVLGRPQHEDGSDTTLGRAIDKFARRLQGRYHKPVSYIDERLSSYAALNDGTEVRRSGLDAAAARIILETWLAENAPK